MKKENDPVEHPSHYNQGEIECIDAIKSMLGLEGFIAYCQGNAMKYLWRHQYKGKAEEDLKKAHWYQNRIIDVLESIEQKNACDELTRLSEEMGLYEHQQPDEKLQGARLAQGCDIGPAQSEAEPNTGWNPSKTWIRG